jgi:hypothetical protein
MAQYRTLRVIGERMGWAPSTVLRRHKLDNFPLYLDFTVRGLIWVTSDELIHRWELQKVMMSRLARLKRPWKQRHKPSYRSYNYRLRDKYRTGNGTVRPSPEQESLRSLREGLAKLSPAEQAWVFENELTPAQREELGVGLPEIPAASQPSGPLASKEPCPCGVPSRCLVANGSPLEKESARPISEEPPKLAPVNPAPAVNRKPSMASQNVRPEGCSCGTSVKCFAH